MVAKCRHRVDGVDNIAGKVARMRGGEAHAPDAGNLSNGSEQFGEAPLPFRVAVGIHILPEQLDLGVAGIGHALRFGQHRRRGAAAFLAARVRHHAVGAELVAALDDGDVSAMRIGASGELGLECLLRLAVVEPGNVLSSLLQLHQHLRQLVIGGRAGNDRHVGRALEDPFAFLLGDAAEHGETFALLVQRLVFVETIEDLLLGLIADRAGVVQNEVGRFFRSTLV